MRYLYIVAPRTEAGVMAGFTRKYALKEWLERKEGWITRHLTIHVMKGHDGGETLGAVSGTVGQLLNVLKEKGFWE